MHVLMTQITVRSVDCVDVSHLNARRYKMSSRKSVFIKKCIEILTIFTKVGLVIFIYLHRSV